MGFFYLFFLIVTSYCRQLQVTYAFKKDTPGERHGSKAERLLAEQRKKKNKFQPMPASFGLVPELTKRIKDKRLRYKAYQERSTDALNDFKNKLDSCFDKEHLLSKIY